MARASTNTKWGDTGITREELHDRKRRALVATAARVFKSKGVQETSMDDIAAELNVSKAAIYYYVKNKQELIFLCHNLAFDIGDEALEEAMREGRTARERLELTIRKYIEKLTGELGGGALMTADSAMKPEHLAVVTERRRKWDASFRDLVARGIADGSLKAVDPKLTEFFIMGAIRSLHRWYSPDGPLSGDEIADALVEMVFRGIGA